MMMIPSDRTMQTTGDSAISALFSRACDGVSIVDQLMDMASTPDVSVSPQWDAAVKRRLERKLADAMRAVIDKSTGEGEPDRAAC